MSLRTKTNCADVDVGGDDDGYDGAALVVRFVPLIAAVCVIPEVDDIYVRNDVAVAAAAIAASAAFGYGDRMAFV